LSITDFYTSFAGQHDEINFIEKDVHANPKGREYDLGLESAFGMFSVLMYNFNDNDPGMQPKTLFDEARNALETKGFRVVVAANLKEFFVELPNHDQVWFTSAKYDNLGDEKDKFVEEIVKFHNEGKGIAIWADNNPFFFQANLALPKLLNITLVGNTPGNKILSLSNDKSPSTGHFARHLITTGILKLYEGDTLSYPSNVTKDMEVIGMSTDRNPCFFTAHPENKGRILVDCGFTKLYPKFWGKTAGTERFVRNIAVWLLGLDWRMKMGAPVKGSVHVEKQG